MPIRNREEDKFERGKDKLNEKEKEYLRHSFWDFVFLTTIKSFVNGDF